MVWEGNCQKCGYHYVGWSLRYPNHQTCPNCGARLKVTNHSRRVMSSQSLSRVKGHIMDFLNTPIPPNQEKKKENNQTKE